MPAGEGGWWKESTESNSDGPQVLGVTRPGGKYGPWPGCARPEHRPLNNEQNFKSTV